MGALDFALARAVAMSEPVERFVRLREEIARNETELRSALGDLGQVARRAVNPLDRIAGREWLLVSGAFALGFWLGRPGRSRATGRR